MAAGKLQLTCDTEVRDILCGAIRAYAAAAYPAGGSDCAQVARYTLDALAQQIEVGCTGAPGRVEISRRPRAMVRAALQYHFDCLDAETAHVSSRQRALFEALLRGEAVTRDALAAARVADAAGQA